MKYLKEKNKIYLSYYLENIVKFIYESEFKYKNIKGIIKEFFYCVKFLNFVDNVEFDGEESIFIENRERNDSDDMKND